MSAQTDEENPKKPTPWYKDMHIILTIILTALFIVSLYPQSGIILNTNNLFLLSFIVVLILSHRFSEIEIKPFLKLSKIIESVKEETQELRNILIQIHLSMTSIAQAQAISQSSATVNVNTLGDNARDISVRIGLEEIPELIDYDVPQRTDLQRVRDYFNNGDYVATFAVLRNLLEEELMGLLTYNQLTIPRWGLASLNMAAHKNELITVDVFDGIEIVRTIANTFIHPRARLDESYPVEKIEFIVELGLKVYHELKVANLKA